MYHFTKELSPLKVYHCICVYLLHDFYYLNLSLSLSLSLSLPLSFSLSLQVPSPHLFSKEVLKLEPNLPIKKQQPHQSEPSTTHIQPATPTLSTVATTGKKSSNQNSSADVGGSGTVLNIPQQLLQKLLASASQVSYMYVCMYIHVYVITSLTPRPLDPSITML